MARLLLPALISLSALLGGCVVPPELEHPPLSAAHRDAPCSGCHGESLDGEVPGDCASCHVAPEGHVDGPCERCHDGGAWDDGSFDHPAPLPHATVVQDCGACHPSGDQARVSCLRCHAHGADRVSPPHLDAGVPGYEFKTGACLRCHPDAMLH